MGKDSQHADKNIKYCLQCKRCWEMIAKSRTSRIRKILVYYLNFPTYGKKKEVCKKCKKEEINE